MLSPFKLGYSTFQEDNITFYYPKGKSDLEMLRFGSYPRGGGSGNELGIIIREGRLPAGKIANEMSHRNLAMLVGKPAVFYPRWFDEGLAS